jgi:hypothetical protein
MSADDKNSVNFGLHEMEYQTGQFASQYNVRPYENDPVFTGAARSTAWTPTGPILQTVYVFMR